MQMLRPFLVVLMTLLILPWGAYAHGLAPQAVAPSAPDMTAREAVGDHRLTVRHAPAQLSKPKTCRTMTLPGAACGADRVLPISDVPGVTVTKSASERVVEDWHFAGVKNTPPREPPRLI